MARPHHKFLNADDTYNTSAIMRAAWVQAFNKRARFAASLKKVWEEAKSEKDSLAWYAEADRVAAAMAAGIAPQAPTAIEAARSALFFAEMNDTARGHELVAAARARLVSLQIAAQWPRTPPCLRPSFPRLPAASPTASAPSTAKPAHRPASGPMRQPDSIAKLRAARFD